MRDAALRLLEQDARFRAAVREGIAQANREEFIEEEEPALSAAEGSRLLRRKQSRVWLASLLN